MVGVRIGTLVVSINFWQACCLFKVRGHGSGAIVLCLESLRDVTDILWENLVIGLFHVGEDELYVCREGTFIISMATEEGLEDYICGLEIYRLLNVGFPEEGLKLLGMDFSFLEGFYFTHFDPMAKYP